VDAHDLGRRFFPIRNVGPQGDYVDLLALMDVLAVPIICGSGDLGQISNFGFKPIQVQVFDASDETCAVMKSYLDRCTGFSNQRKRDDFRVKDIRKGRKLHAHSRLRAGIFALIRSKPLI
jgi:hypothetical protein